jgi:hypothetical protein
MLDYTWSPEALRNIRARVDVRRLTPEECGLLAGLSLEQQKAVDAATQAEWDAAQAAWEEFAEATHNRRQTAEQYQAAVRANRLLRLAMLEAAVVEVGG